MSVPPVSSSPQVPSSWPVGFHAGARGLDTGMTLLLAPLAQLLFFCQYFVRDSKQLTAWGLARPPGIRANGYFSHPCWLKPYQKPKLSLRLRISHGMMRSLFHVELRRPTVTPSNRSSRCYIATPLHLWMRHPVYRSHLEQHVSQSLEIHLTQLDKLSPLRPPGVYTCLPT